MSPDKLIVISHTNHTGILYYDGEEIGRDETPIRRDLITPGTLILGQYLQHDTLDSVERLRYFGGELTGVVVWRRELRAEEVREVYSGGMCAEVTVGALSLIHI